jgi:hypothetical protein
MDCEKFEVTLIDELYDELDELTSAASRRHVEGCARCAALFGGLEATRRLAVLPLVAAPKGLEERILAAEKEARKVVPMERRLPRALSWAGSWAMRPQVAMAALFLLLVGVTSSVLVGRKGDSLSAYSTPPSAEGSSTPAPAPIGPTRPEELAKAEPTTAPPPPAAAAPVATEAPRNEPLAFAKSPRRAYGNVSGLGGAGGSDIANANTPSAGGPAAHMRPSPPATPAAAQGSASSFESDPEVALSAARSVRDGSGGCAQAIARYDALASRAFGSRAGYDAVLEGGQCLRSVGSTEPARQHFSRLIGVPEYAARAQAGLDSLSQIASTAAPPPRAKASKKPPAATVLDDAQQTPPARTPAAADTAATRK